MVKILIINNYCHHKNKIGMINILNYLNYEYKIGSESDIPNYDIIYSPSEPINTLKYPLKKFIFGPHFSVFPDNKLDSINNIHNTIYIQPSIWAANVWKNMTQKLYIKPLPFCVDTGKFNRINNERKSVFIYYKQRHREELLFLENFLRNNNIRVDRVFNYDSKYNENDYLNTLHNSKYGIWLGRHESQGFALEEALSCDVPLLVWDVTSMNQEVGQNYDNIPATSIPYWDNRCGEYFTDRNQLEDKFKHFIENLNMYQPRQYILDNLSTEKVADKFLELLKFLD